MTTNDGRPEGAESESDALQEWEPLLAVLGDYYRELGDHVRDLREGGSTSPAKDEPDAR